MVRNRMHTKILFFLFTLWVGSTRIAQAHNFSSSLTYFNQVTQQVIAKHWHTIVPALKVGALIGIGVLWYKMLAAEKHDAASVGLNGIRDFSSVDSVDNFSDFVENKDQPPQITQLEVSPQGDDASCGYHALKNAREIVEHAPLLQSGEITEELEKKLQNAETATRLFGQQGAWREHVVKKRAQEKIRKDIYNHLKLLKKKTWQPVDFGGIKLLSKDTINYFLHGQMKFGQERKIAVTLAHDRQIHLTIKLSNIISKIDTALYIYASTMADKAINDKQHKVTVTQESLKEFLKTYEFCKGVRNFNKLEDGQTVQDEKAYLEYTRDQYEENKYYSLEDCEYINKAITEFMQKPETLQRYINFDELKEYTFSVERNNGDWLNDAEIESIIKNVDKTEHMPVTIIQDCTVIGRNDASIKSDVEFNGEFKKIAQKIKNASHGYVHAFILGTMTQKDNNGHWYTLVVHAKNDTLHYYVMDSLGTKGTNRVNDENVIKVINKLEALAGNSIDDEEE